MATVIVKNQAYAMARAVCGSWGDTENVARDILSAVSRVPNGKQYAEAARVVRKALAEMLGVPAVSLPLDLVQLAAIGSYEDTKRGYQAEEDFSPGIAASFDRHDILFATYNGVCPRCSKPGDFGETGECSCGFWYD